MSLHQKWQTKKALKLRRRLSVIFLTWATGAAAILWCLSFRGLYMSTLIFECRCLDITLQEGKDGPKSLHWINRELRLNFVNLSAQVTIDLDELGETVFLNDPSELIGFLERFHGARSLSLCRAFFLLGRIIFLCRVPIFCMRHRPLIGITSIFKRMLLRLVCLFQLWGKFGPILYRELGLGDSLILEATFLGQILLEEEWYPS